MLNFGHTLGHAIESFSLAHDANPLSHGEAVGIGMMAEAYLSLKKMGFDKAEYQKVATLLSSLVDMPKYKLKDMEELLQYMYADKKNANGEIRCVLLQAIGHTYYWLFSPSIESLKVYQYVFVALAFTLQMAGAAYLFFYFRQQASAN